MKTCSRCHREKLLVEFYRETKNHDGRTRWCKACMTVVSQRYRATPEYRFGLYRSAAKRRGIPFDLTLDDFSYFWNAPCGYCAEPINGIGLDRIDNEDGYVNGNVIPCCATCNSMKSGLGLLEFIERCQRIADRLYIGTETVFANAAIARRE